MEQIRWLRGILGCFEATSSLAVILLNKGFPIGNLSDMEFLLDCRGCSARILLSKYLGLSLGARISVSLYGIP